MKLAPTPLILSRYIIRKRFRSLRCPESTVFEKSCLKVGKGGRDLRFARSLLAGRVKNNQFLKTFYDRYLHLAPSRVLESLWKHHQSKAIKILHRNYVSIFFPAPKKYIFLGSQKIFSKIFLAENYFFEIFPKIKKFDPKKIGIFEKMKISEKNKISKIFLEIWKLFFFDEKKKLRKKLDHHFDVEICQESIFCI